MDRSHLSRLLRALKVSQVKLQKKGSQIKNKGKKHLPDILLHPLVNLQKLSRQLLGTPQTSTRKSNVTLNIRFELGAQVGS